MSNNMSIWAYCTKKCMTVYSVKQNKGIYKLKNITYKYCRGTTFSINSTVLGHLLQLLSNFNSCKNK